MDGSNLRWWGWGALDHAVSLPDRPRLCAALQAWLALPDDWSETPPVALEEIDLPAPRLDDPMLASLRRLIGGEAVRIDRRTLVEHAGGKSYGDLVRARAGIVPNLPDAVLYPADEGQAAAILSWAADRDVVVIPFGGGSTVTGGVTPPPGERPVLTLDLARLDHLVWLDPVSWTACIQAGATGPEVEAQLGAQGFTLGHFPQSFEFSTLGGWIAARSVGQASTGYGKMEDVLQSARLISPTGFVETRGLPAAIGRRFWQLIAGSAGSCGVITEAVVQVRPRPAAQDYRGVLFPGLADGIEALRDLTQRGPRPTIACLLDARGMAAFAAQAQGRHGLSGLADRAVESYLARTGRTGGDNCLLIVGYDGEARSVHRWQRLAAALCRGYGGLPLGRAVGEAWKQERFAWPYLRDALVGGGLLVDTVEAVAPWSNLLRLYEGLTSMVGAAVRASGGGPGYVMTEVVHASAGGASLRVTFLGRRAAGQEIEQWQTVKQAAVEAVLSTGGVLCCGLGRDSAAWFPDEVGSPERRALRALKQALDPAGIMNPEVLF